MSKVSERIDYFLERIDDARSKLTEHKLPNDAVCRRALTGMLNSRTGRVLASCPTFRERPLASLLHRLVAFHGSGGSLYGVFGIEGDCRLLVDYNPDKYGKYWTDPKSKLADDQLLLDPDTTSKELYDQLDTLALVCRGGKSSAAEAWQRAIYG